MSQADYDAKEAQFLAITPDAMKKPNMPVKIYLQEAENQLQWALQDKAALLAAGFDWTLVDDLPQRIGALRVAESNWFSERHSREEVQQRWEIESPKAYALRDQLLRAMRYAYRKDASLMKRVSEIAEGSGHADMIQDLNDIAVLGRDYSAPLQAINVDLADLDRAANVADAMGELLALVNGERASDNSARVIRDQAYTLLKQAVDEVRACGQYVFWDNESRRDGYFSAHLRSRRSASAGSKDVESTESEAVS